MCCLAHRAEQLVDACDPKRHRGVFSTTDAVHAEDDYFRTSGDKIRCFLEQEAVTADGGLNREKHLAINKIGHAMHDQDPVFEGFVPTAKMRTLATLLGFQDPRLLQSMYIFKQPHIGGEMVWHQDATFLRTEPESVIGLWSAIDDATTENGCLWARPGSHLGPLRRWFGEVEGALITRTLDDTPWPEDAVPLEVSSGTLVVVHGRSPHMSQPNRSAIPRHAHALHLIEAAADYPADNWLKRPGDMLPSGF